MNQDENIGIVVCTHNRPVMLKKAMENICSQSHSNITVVVVDDNSQCREENERIIKAFDASSTHLFNTKTLGITESRNRGLAYLMTPRKTRIVCMLDDDDRWPKERLALGLAEMHPEVGMSFGIQQMTDDKLNLIRHYPCRAKYHRAMMHALVFGEVFFPAKTYMFNTEFLQELQLEPNVWYGKYTSREDSELGLRALRHLHKSSKWTALYIDSVLAYWVQDRSLTKFSSPEYLKRQRESHAKIIDEYFPTWLRKTAKVCAPYQYRYTSPHWLRFGRFTNLLMTLFSECVSMIDRQS